MTTALANRLIHFRDSRGERVPRWPDVLLPSATVVVVRRMSIPLEQPWEILCHQRADNQWWALPGGAMEIGESVLACARREILEECGLSISRPVLVSIDSDPATNAIVAYPDNRLIQYCNLTFVALAIHGTLAKSSESVQLEWRSTTTLPEPFLPAHRWRLAQAERWRACCATGQGFDVAVR